MVAKDSHVRENSISVLYRIILWCISNSNNSSYDLGRVANLVSK